ncbi:MAG TPA: SDR family NAD(P)-dependent oxidoreductase [Acidimicrobiales bacterium]
MFSAAGRVALVTGAGRGVGAGIVRALAGQGAAVVVNDVDADAAAALAGSVREGGGRAHDAAFDVTDLAAVDEAVGRIAAEVGPVDILVNNAGIPAGMAARPFHEMDPDEWRQYVDLNLYGSLHCTRAVLGAMRARGWGRIVQISSGAGRTGLAIGVSLYGASKSAIEGFVRHLSQEVGGDGVTANTLALGPMAHSAGDDAEIVRRLARGVPVGRLGTPEDVGAAVVYLASDEAAWLTGQTIALDGGATTR